MVAEYWYHVVHEMGENDCMKKDEHLLKVFRRNLYEFVLAVLEFLQHDFLGMIFDLIAGVFGTWHDRESMKEQEKSEEQKAGRIYEPDRKIKS